MKIIEKGPILERESEENVIREIKNHLRVRSQNIITLYHVFHDQKYIYMMLEYMPDGSLFQYWKRNGTLSEKTTAKIVYDVCLGLQALHREDIIHRDIKLENILMSQGTVKIGDMGCSVQSVAMRKSSIGSPGYLSPEQLNHFYYNKKIDLWSLGIIAYECLFGESPYEKDIETIMYRDKKHQLPEFSFPSSIKISEHAKSFISQLLDRNPNSRLDVEAALRHPFLKYFSEKEKALPYLLR